MTLTGKGTNAKTMVTIARQTARKNVEEYYVPTRSRALAGTKSVRRPAAGKSGTHSHDAAASRPRAAKAIPTRVGAKPAIIITVNQLWLTMMISGAFILVLVEYILAGWVLAATLAASIAYGALMVRVYQS